MRCARLRLGQSVVSGGIILMLSASWAGAAPARSARVELKLEAPGRTTSMSLKELESKFPRFSLTVDDPVYRERKTFEGFWLKDLLSAVGMTEESGDELVFHCADGYSATLPLAKIAEKRGLIAFREKGVKAGWKPFHPAGSEGQPGKEIVPAPFYLVWDTQDPAFPWPYQLVRIELVRVKQKFAKIFPEGVDAASPIHRGFERYRAACLKCHSLNGVGGDVGPEFNFPMNILEYRDEAFMTRFTRSPQSFRARSPMPGFPRLKDEELSEIYAYLRWIQGRKLP